MGGVLDELFVPTGAGIARESVWHQRERVAGAPFFFFFFVLSFPNDNIVLLFFTSIMRPTCPPLPVHFFFFSILAACFTLKSPQFVYYSSEEAIYADCFFFCVCVSVFVLLLFGYIAVPARSQETGL